MSVSTSVHGVAKITVAGHQDGSHRWLNIEFVGPETEARPGEVKLMVSVHLSFEGDNKAEIVIGDSVFTAFEEINK